MQVETMQLDTYFRSVGFTIGAIIFMILTIILYIKKIKKQNLSGRLFLAMLIITIIILIFEMIIPFAMFKYNSVENNKIYYSILLKSVDHFNRILLKNKGFFIDYKKDKKDKIGWKKEWINIIKKL